MSQEEHSVESTLLNEIYARIARKEFQAALTILAGLWGIHIPNLYFRKVLKK